MREIALATQITNKEIIDFINVNIKSKIDFCKTIVTNYIDNNFCYLLFACEDEFVLPCERIITDIIVDYIESIYKVKYLCHRIKKSVCDNLVYNAYIKVLSLFDRKTDELALKDIIMFNQTFFVDSFLVFRINPLKRHWDNLAEISSDNLALFNSNTFLDIIKFLLESMDSDVYKLKLVINQNCYAIYNMKDKNAKIKKVAEYKEITDVISAVLNCCPYFVDVYLNSNVQDEVVGFLSSVFANRLKVFTKV